MVDKRVLSPELKVACKIFEFNRKEKKIWFSKLVKELEGEVSRATISKDLDRLFDLGIVDGSWEKIEGERWARTFRIAGEASKFISNIYNEISEK